MTLPTMFDLTGKTAFVTGASSGLGAHFARTLAAAGAGVVLAARRMERLEALADEIGETGGSATAVEMDVTVPDSINGAIAAGAKALGNIHILVNNSGTAVTKAALDTSVEDWDHVVDTNLKGAWLVAQATARHMADHGEGGSIINIASILAIRVAKALPSYVASKAGLLHLTRALALELADRNIRLNAIAPGYFETEMNKGFFDTDAGKKIVKRVPYNRIGRIEELDGPLLLLASDAGSYMTGSLLVVDGGHSVNSL